MAKEPMLVIDDTLVLVNLSPDNHRIPAHGPKGEAIRYVGKGAAPTGHKTLIVEEGIEEVQSQYTEALELPTTVKRCFGNDLGDYPATIRIWRRMTRQRWRELLRHAVRAADGRHIFTCPPEAIDLLLPTLKKHQLITWIPEDANELICAKERISKRQQMTASFDCVGIRKDRKSVCPLASLAELARAGQRVQQHPDAEEMSDSYLRGTHFAGRENVRFPRYDSAYVLVAEEPIACRGATDLMVLFTLQMAIWYYCSTVPITYGGKQYMIGCLNELSAKDIRPYHRWEWAVFSGDGLISDRKITEAVYEKFLLMSFV